MMARTRADRSRLARLEHAVAAMATPTREIFLMHRLESLGYREIGERLDLSPAEVERHIAAAMLHLSREMDRAGPAGQGGDQDAPRMVLPSGPGVPKVPRT